MGGVRLKNTLKATKLPGFTVEKKRGANAFWGGNTRCLGYWEERMVDGGRRRAKVEQRTPQKKKRGSQCLETGSSNGPKNEIPTRPKEGKVDRGTEKSEQLAGREERLGSKRTKTPTKRRPKRGKFMG